MTTTLEGLTPDTVAAVQMLFEHAAQLGFSATLRSAKRSCSLQNQIYAQGRTAPGAITTYAQGCNSWHVLGRSVDLTIAHGTEAQYGQLAAYWKSLGGKWGGDFGGAAAALRDVGHYEWHPGLKIADVCLNPAACQVDEDRNAHGGAMPLGSGGGGVAPAEVEPARAGWGSWLAASAVLGTTFGLFWMTTHLKPAKGRR